MVESRALRLCHVCSCGWAVRRGTEKEEAIEKRLKNARREMERSSDVSLFNHLIVNDDLETTYAKIKVAAPFRVHTRMRVHMRAHIHTCMYIQVFVHGHIYTHSHVHTHIYS